LHKQEDPLPAPALADGTFEITYIVDRTLVDFTDDIGGFQTDLICGTSGLNLDDQHTFSRIQAQPAGRLGSNPLDPNSDLRVPGLGFLHGVTVVGELADLK
jgi:hypothetical protein